MTTHNATALDGDWIEAAPFRAHLRHLISASGVPWRVIATVADIPPSVLQRLLTGRNGRPIRRINPDLARQLLSVSVADLHESRYRPVNAAPVARKLKNLVAAGWTPSDLSSVLGLSQVDLRSVLGGMGECTELIAIQVNASYPTLRTQRSAQLAVPAAA